MVKYVTRINLIELYCASGSYRRCLRLMGHHFRSCLGGYATARALGAPLSVVPRRVTTPLAPWGATAITHSFREMLLPLVPLGVAVDACASGWGGHRRLR